MAQRRRQKKGNWHADTQALLGATNIPYQDITRATNIPENWLHRFNAGRIADPGVNRVECLYRYLLEANRSA